MLINIILLILILALVNNLSLPFIHQVIFTLNNKGITIYEIILLMLFVYLLSYLPRPFKEIVGLILLLWLLSVLGVLAIGGFTNIILAALLITLIFKIFR